MSERPVQDPNAVTVVLAPACGDPSAAARRILVRMAAELGVPVPPGAVPRVAYDAGGRPCLSVADGAVRPVDEAVRGAAGAAGGVGEAVRGVGGGALCRVSISHCADVVAVALAAAAVGVDVEAVRPLPFVNLARRWFDPAEAAWLARRPEEHRQGDFFRLWTAKEALGKALGVGLRNGGTRRRVPLPRPLGTRWTPFPGRPFALALPECPRGLVLAVATADPGGAPPPLRLYGSGVGGCRPWSGRGAS
ncbi:4'-phosphopantetheinyl transferase family protein [Streptomyces sp. NPDC020800]|uniref:4'-phosphopantetheinyl transferase family protein n=1 Tax=Streptomyces sp. NPDC020800 TaxID=3365092 RepID=UPI0037A6B546